METQRNDIEVARFEWCRVYGADLSECLAVKQGGSSKTSEKCLLQVCIELVVNDFSWLNKNFENLSKLKYFCM